MKIVSDWKQAWKWFSVQAFVVIALLPMVWAELPQDVKAMLPPEWRPWVFSIIALAGVLGRVKDQPDA